MVEISVLYKIIKYADDTFDLFCKQKESENQSECVEKMIDSLLSTNEEAFTELCSVVKHLGSGDSTQEVGRNTRLRLVFLPTFFSCYRHFLRALQRNRAQYEAY